MNELITPNDNDVLAGRGHGVNRHLGNKKFRAIVAGERSVYAGTTDRHKRLIVSQIVEQIHNSYPPGRFLTETKGIWRQMAPEHSKKKTAQALRERPNNEATQPARLSGLDQITLEVDVLDVLDKFIESSTSMDNIGPNDEHFEPLHHLPALVQSPSSVSCTDINEMSVSSFWSRAGLLNRLQSLSSMSLQPKWITDGEENISLENDLDVESLVSL